MRWRLALLAFFILAPARAGVPAAQLAGVVASPAPGAAFPMSTQFIDEAGHKRSLADIAGGNPAVVIFADYTCTNLCGPVLAFAAAALAKTGLAPGRDFHLAVIGLDPKDRPRDAIAMKEAQIGATALAKASVFLIGDAETIAQTARAAGYHYVYDAGHDQFAHPAAAYVISKDGRIVRVLSGLGLSGDNLRLALVDAGRGQVGTTLDQVRLHCFGFDPARGIYTASVTAILMLACGATVIVLAGGIALMALMRRRAA